MFAAIARFAIRFRRLVLVGAVVLFLAAGAIGGDVAENLSTGGFDDPGSESYRADKVMLETFGEGVPNLVLVVTADPEPDPVLPAVDRPEAIEAGLALTEALASEDGVRNVVSYWSLNNASPLRSEGGNRALVLARLVGSDDQIDARVKELEDVYAGDFEGVDVEFTGFAHIFARISEIIEEDLLLAEMIAIPITLVLLLFVFRGVVAALLPLVVGGLSVISTFMVLEVVNWYTQVSVFALNMTTAMGLGLAIDYALFVVNRYREELDQGFDYDTALSRTVQTAGRTIAFSAGTVAASLLALLVFPLAFLKSFAYAGLAVGLLAGVYSVVVLPALLSALGPKIHALSTRRRPRTKTLEQGFWYRAATGVMKRPLPVVTAIVALLVFVGIPFLRVELGIPDDRVLRPGHEQRETTDVLRDEFSSVEAGAVSVVATGIGDPLGPGRSGQIDDYAAALSSIDHVARVDAATGIYIGGQQLVPASPDLVARHARGDATFLSVVPDTEVNSLVGVRLVEDIRSTDVAFDVQVTGNAAQLTDAREALYGTIPVAIGIIAVVTFVLLFMLFGSVVVPLKALVLNLLSLSATFGAIVWVFQDGNLSGFLGFEAVGTTDATSPILLFCVAFGLSMDYEVFLLSRIKEEYDRTGDNEQSVAIGLEKTGRIVTAAALLISVVFIAIGTSQVRFIKLFGLGLAVAVLMDAFVIRGTLVPAFMKLADRANWWAPGPLRRLHAVIGVSEHVDLDPPPARRDAPDGVAAPVDGLGDHRAALADGPTRHAASGSSNGGAGSVAVNVAAAPIDVHDVREWDAMGIEPGALSDVEPDDVFFDPQPARRPTPER